MTSMQAVLPVHGRMAEVHEAMSGDSACGDVHCFSIQRDKCTQPGLCAADNMSSNLLQGWPCPLLSRSRPGDHEVLASTVPISLPQHSQEI